MNRDEYHMSEALRTIHVDPGSEIDRLLDEAAETDLLLEKEGVHYRLNRVRVSDETRTAQREPTRLHPERALNIVGLGESEAGSDIAQYKDRYVADAADHRGV